MNTNKTKLSGLIAATYTPMLEDGSLNLAQVPPMVDKLLADGIKGFYLCGSTGEGMSLSTEERRSVAEAYIDAVAGRAPVIVQVGHNSLADAKLLAEHAQKSGADVLSATCPSYYKINCNALLTECMSEIASAAPDLPFYYYHIPALTGSSVDIVEFLPMAQQNIPTLVGVKYTEPLLHEYLLCNEFNDGQFDILWGVDEMLLGALACGAEGAIGSTYNIMAPLYERLWNAYNQGEMDTARQLQSRAALTIRTIAQFPFHSAMKEILRIQGIDLGPCRLPQAKLSNEEKIALKNELDAVGFFD